MAESAVLCPGRRRHAAGPGFGRHSGDPAALWVGARPNRSGQHRVRPNLTCAAQSAGRRHPPGHRDCGRYRDLRGTGHSVCAGIAPPRDRSARSGGNIVTAGAAAGLGNDQEAVPPTRLADDRLLDLAAAARSARTDIDLDQEGRGTTIHQRRTEQEPVAKPALQRGAAGDHLPESTADLHPAAAGHHISRSVGSLCDQLAADTLALASDSRLVRGCHLLGGIRRLRLGRGHFGTHDRH